MDMLLFTFIAFALLGLIIGSFLNALVWRLRHEESLMTRSMCPQCRHLIRWYDNIPVLSFVLLGGRCRSCRMPISWQYPLVEMVTALGFGIIGAVSVSGSGVLVGQGTSFGNILAVDLLFWLLMFSLLMGIFVYDVLYLEIPMILIWIGLGAAGAYFLWSDWSLLLLHPYDGDSRLALLWAQSRILWGIIAGGGAFGVFTWLSKGSNERLMGWGDAWLVLLLGFVLGWPGVLWVITLGSSLGSLIGIGLLLHGKGTLKTQLPFAPFLILGFWGTITMDFLFRLGPGVNFW